MFCEGCGKQLVETVGFSNNDPEYYDIKTGEKKRKKYKWYDCPEYTKHRWRNVEQTHLYTEFGTEIL